MSAVLQQSDRSYCQLRGSGPEADPVWAWQYNMNGTLKWIQGLVYQ